MTGLPWDQRLARVVARGLARTPISPNQETTLGLVLGLSAAFLFAQGEPAPANWAGLLFMLAAFNDHVDGELARLTGKTSRFGHYYDHVAAGASYIGAFVGIGFGLRTGAVGEWAVLLGLAAGVSIFVIFSVRAGMEASLGKETTAQPSFAGFEIEDTLYLLGPVTWAGWLEPVLVAAGIGTPLFLLWVLWDWRRQRSAVKTEAGPP